MFTGRHILLFLTSEYKKTKCKEIFNELARLYFEIDDGDEVVYMERKEEIWQFEGGEKRPIRQIS